MPSLEIISIGAPYSNDWGSYTHLRYLAFPRLISGRGIFQDDLNQLQGVLVRLGNSISDDGCNIERSYELIDSKQVDRDIAELGHAHVLRSLPGVVEGIKQLLRVALQRSPIAQAIFLSDYQLAGDDKRSDEKILESRFGNLLLGGQLIFNTKYLITIDI
jgi:hypothetical protein